MASLRDRDLQVARAPTAGASPCPRRRRTEGEPAREGESDQSASQTPGRPRPPRVPPLISSRDSRGAVPHDRARRGLDAPPRAAEDRRHESGAVRRNEDAGRTRALPRSADGPRGSLRVATGPRAREERRPCRELLGGGRVVKYGSHQASTPWWSASHELFRWMFAIELHLDARLVRLRSHSSLHGALGRPDLKALSPIRAGAAPSRHPPEGRRSIDVLAGSSQVRDRSRPGTSRNSHPSYVRSRQEAGRSAKSSPLRAQLPLRARRDDSGGDLRALVERGRGQKRSEPARRSDRGPRLSQSCGRARAHPGVFEAVREQPRALCSRASRRRVSVGTKKFRTRTVSNRALA